MDSQKFGTFIAQCRKDKKMTQSDLAAKLNVTDKAISRWERGTSEPNTSNLMALARLYGIPAEDLLKGVESALEAQEKES